MKESRYKLGDISLAESFRMDAQAISPTEFTNISAEVLKTQNIIEAKYGGYIPQLRRDKNVDLSKRIVVADDQAVRLYDEYSGYGEFASEDHTTFGIYHWPEHLILLNNEAEGRMKQEFDVHVQNDSTHEITLEDYLAYVIHRPSLLPHEIMHTYLDQVLPHLFSEVACWAYTSEINDELGNEPFANNDIVNVVTIYRESEGVFGESLHKAAFGEGGVSRYLRSKIIDYVSSQVEEQEDFLNTFTTDDL